MKTKIGVDLDGVLADFTMSMFSVANEIWPGRFPPGTPSPVDWNWSDIGITKEDSDVIWKAIKKTNNFWLFSIPHVENVLALQEFVWNHPNVDVYYLTSRVPTEGLSVLSQSGIWLRQLGLIGAHTSILPIHAREKHRIYASLGVELFVDDYLPTIALDPKHGVLLDRSWNREGREKVNGLKVVSTMKDFLELVWEP